MKRFSILSALTVGLALAFAGVARADTTLGSTVKPTGSSGSPCGMNRVVNQVTSAPSTPYSVPGSGKITQWQTNASVDTPGSAVTLVVLKPVGASFTVVGVDARTIPT